MPLSEPVWASLNNIEFHAGSMAKGAHTARAIHYSDPSKSNDWLVFVGSCLHDLLKNCEDIPYLKKELDDFIERRNHKEDDDHE